MNSPRIKSFRNKLKLKIDTKLTAFKSSSTQSSPTSHNKHHPSMLSAIAESTSDVKYNKNKAKKKNNSKIKPLGINIKRRNQQNGSKNNLKYNYRNTDPSTPTPYNSPYNPSTPTSQSHENKAYPTPCIGYDTPCNDRNDIHYNYDININQESMECDDNITSPLTPITPKTPITPHSYRDRQRRINAVKHILQIYITTTNINKFLFYNMSKLRVLILTLQIALDGKCHHFAIKRELDTRITQQHTVN